jgi:hypothetical protein
MLRAKQHGDGLCLDRIIKFLYIDNLICNILVLELLNQGKLQKQQER